MIAGRPENETEKLICAIREICPNMGFIKKNGEIMLTGNDIRRLREVLNVLSRIDRIDIANKYETAAMLEIKEDRLAVTDMQDGNKGEAICVIT